MKNLMCVCVLAAGAAFAQTAQELTTAETFKGKDGAALPYRQYVPADRPAGQKIPLVLFLHGAGERGNDNAAQLKHGVPAIIQYCRDKKLPVALIAPQCPENQQWVDTPWSAMSSMMNEKPSASMALAMALLDDRIAALDIDTSRVYVTGISMGGYGTWDIIEREPEKFAAAIPICGGGDTWHAWKIRELPIWAFHGDSDGAVPVQRSRLMVSALWDCGGKIYYREYPGMNHDVWTKTYADTMVLDWLFAQKRGAK
jgi:predicted peptidase